MKQMALLPSPSGKGWTCGAACPLQGTYSSPLTFTPDTKDKGKVMINGKECEKYVGHDVLLKVVQMDEKDFYVSVTIIHICS